MDTFINNVINTWGDAGAIWLNDLADTIDSLCKKWNLTDIVAFPNLTYGFVAKANQHNKPVVLKISHDPVNQEYLFLKEKNGNGMVVVLDADESVGALLLERAVPGLSLKNHHSPFISKKIAIYADVVNKIASSAKLSKDTSYPHVREWCDALVKVHSPLISQKLSDKAIELTDYLLKTSKNEYFCHGDLHLDNIIQNDDKWIGIDPKGIVAEKEFEVSAFDLLSPEELSKQVNLAKRIMSRSYILATQFGFEPQRLLAWTFVRHMLSAKWHIEDNGDPSKDIFLAEQVFSLLKEDK